MWMYSLEDVQLCLDRGAIGEYGPIYNRIDPATILEWFPKYDAQRAPFVDAIRMEKEQQNNIYEIFNHPQINQALHETVDRLKMQEAPKVESKRVSNSPFEKQIIEEYDALPEWKESKWFKVYQNKPYQFTEYRKQRYMEEIDNQNEY
jgi:hypothetical protein